MISEHFKVELAKRLGADLPSVQRFQSIRPIYKPMESDVPSSDKQTTHTSLLQSTIGQKSLTVPLSMKSTHEQSSAAQLMPPSTQTLWQTARADHAYSKPMVEQKPLSFSNSDHDRSPAVQSKSKSRGI